MKSFVPCATWRSTGTYADVFYLESFIEEMPHAARKEIVHDQGHAIVNPEAAERRMRGMMAWGLAPAFNPEVSFRHGVAEQIDFDITPHPHE